MTEPAPRHRCCPIDRDVAKRRVTLKVAYHSSGTPMDNLLGRRRSNVIFGINGGPSLESTSHQGTQVIIIASAHSVSLSNPYLHILISGPGCCIVAAVVLQCQLPGSARTRQLGTPVKQATYQKRFLSPRGTRIRPDWIALGQGSYHSA